MRCRLRPSLGVDFNGSHELEVLPGSRPGTAVLRHTIVARPTPAALLVWGVAIRWLHDALLEDLPDRTASTLGQPPDRPVRWSPWVRLLRVVAARS